MQNISSQQIKQLRKIQRIRNYTICEPKLDIDTFSCIKDGCENQFFMIYVNFPSYEIVRPDSETELQESFNRFNLLQSFKGESFAHIQDVFLQDRAIYIVMDYEERLNFRDFIKNAEQLFSGSEILNFVYQFLEGYKTIFENQLVFEIFSTFDIYLVNNYYKINHLALYTKEEICRLFKSIKNSTPVRPNYLFWSPERRSFEPLSSKSDMFSLGIILYQMTFLQPIANNLPKLELFHLQISEKPFKIDISFSQIANQEFIEIYYLIESLLIFNEQQRIGFEELYARIKNNPIYHQYRVKLNKQNPSSNLIELNNKFTNSQYDNQGYEIKWMNLIGNGSTCQVFECISHQDKSLEICVKIINKNNQPEGRFDQEIGILNLTKDKNNLHFVKVYDYFSFNDSINIVMEHCQEGSLENYIANRKKQKKNIDSFFILNFVYQFLEGYELLYENNIVHGDIKPSNILLQDY